MSLDFYLMRTQPTEVFSRNITHNLTRMASAAGIYDALWHPENLKVTRAEQLIEPLAKGLALLEADPAKFKQYNAPNGWGMYEHFVPFVRACLEACREFPDAEVRTST